MNKRRIIKTVASLTLVASLVIALPIMGTEGNQKNETLATIEKTILEKNLDVLSAKDTLMIAEYKEDEADEREGTGASTTAIAMNNDYYPKEADMNVAYAIWSLENVQESKVLEGKELFYDYKYLQDEIKLQQGKIERLKRTLSQVETKIGLGTATVSAKTTAELDIQRAEYDMQVLVNDRERIFLDLNRLMGYDFDTQLVFDDTPLVVEKYVSDNLQEDIDYVLEHNGDLIKLSYEKDLASIDRRIYVDANGDEDNDATLTSKSESITNLAADLKSEIQSTEYEVRSKYNALLNSYDAFVIKELEQKNLQMTLDIKTKRFNVGMETQSSVDLAQENLDFAKLSYEKAKLDYYVAVESYKNFIN